MKTILSFIIVTWNNEDTIIDCLDSIYKNCKNFEIIIVDNNSSDNTIKIIKNKKYNYCKIIESKENLGFAGGNNLGLKYVNSDYICYLNPDTILLEDIIQPSLYILKNKPEVGVVGSKLLYKNMKLQSSTFNFDTPKQIFIENLRLSRLLPNFLREKYFPYCSKCKYDKYVEWLIGAELILKTSDAKKVNGFSTDYYMYTEDMDLCKKIEKFLNKKCYYLANNKLIHIGGISESKNINYDKLKIILRNKLIFIKKFYSDKEIKKAYKSMMSTYKIRYFITLLLSLFPYEKAKYYNNKMKKSIIFLFEVGEELGVK